jgi:alanine racemase
VPFRNAGPLVHDLASRASVEIAGIMMTFTEDPEFDVEQLRRFESLTLELRRAGLELGRRHAASSFALFQRPDSFLDMVRPGMALYGIYPEAGFRKTGALDLVPALALKARVAYVKQLRPGESAGYNRAYVANRAVWIATLPVGHADGLPRAAAKGGRVRIGEVLYPIVASVSASHTIVEIGDDRRVEIGDEATIFDWTEGSRPEDLAAACGTSVYDLAMHLNPTLPRRIVRGL